MTIDPICGMEVEESKAIKLEKNGETYFFCSKSCQDKFVNKAKDINVNKK
ncbi:MAG: YHS domain-containing protein [Candidatus Omnitrophota bacterium]